MSSLKGGEKTCSGKYGKSVGCSRFRWVKDGC
jgi:hypothetical protein